MRESRRAARYHGRHAPRPTYRLCGFCPALLCRRLNDRCSVRLAGFFCVKKQSIEGTARFGIRSLGFLDRFLRSHLHVMAREHRDRTTGRWRNRNNYHELLSAPSPSSYCGGCSLANSVRDLSPSPSKETAKHERHCDFSHLTSFPLESRVFGNYDFSLKAQLLLGFILGC